MQAQKNSDRKAKGQAKAKNPSRPKNSSKSSNSRAPSTMGAAKHKDLSKSIGMKDLIAHKISWITGSVYVGNGVLGALNEVVFRRNDGLQYVDASTGAGAVPLLGSDSILGQSYVRDVERHYARKVIKSQKIRLQSIQPSTANSMVVLIAPIRGPAASGDTVTVTGTTAGPSYANVVGMTGAISVPSYSNAEIDMTPYIASGSGARQNEFTVNRDGDTAGTQWGSGTVDMNGIAPSAFVVSGSNTTAALQGTVTHFVIIEQVVDYLDFNAGMVNPFPFALSLSREECLQLVRAIVASSNKEIRESRIFRTLMLEASRGSAGPVHGPVHQ